MLLPFFHPLPGVNFINPLEQGANALEHRVGHKRCCPISATELRPILPVQRTFFKYFFWCDLPLLAVFIIFILFLPSSDPSYPSSF
jgi:hypothetical protein